jgi:hypothetical protein
VFADGLAPGFVLPGSERDVTTLGFGIEWPDVLFEAIGAIVSMPQRE